VEIMPYKNREERILHGKLHYYKYRQYYIMKSKIHGRTLSGKLSYNKYNNSEKGKLSKNKYENSEKGKLTRKIYTKNSRRWELPKIIEYMKQYNKKHDRPYRLRKKIFDTFKERNK